MEVKELKQLIAYHQSGLDQYRQHMAPSSQYLEEQTIMVLKELAHMEELRASAQKTIKEAKAILEKS